MCGLLGFTGDHLADPGKLRVLYMINKSRGTDSTGLFGNRMMKKVGDADVLLKDPNFDTIARSYSVLGHTRQSTGTARTKENAHPFLFGEGSDYTVVGTHNGSIFNEYEMEQKIDGFTRASVDSASIYKAISQTKDIKRVVSMLEGHVALAFKINDIFYMYRRESRPLFLGKAREGWYYSSIKDALRMISIPEEKIFDLTPHKLLSFRGSRMILREDMALPRVAMDTTKTSYNWDNGLSGDLKEELTGKKHIPVVTTPITKSLTGAKVSTIAGGTTEEETNSILYPSSQKELVVQETRIVSLAEMKAPGMPRLFGKSILMPASKIHSNHEYTDFLRQEMKKHTDINVVYPNYFKSDQTIPFWLKHLNTIIASNIYMVPQKIGTREDCENNSEINIAIKPMFYSKLSDTIHLPSRQSLFMFVTIDDDTFSTKINKKYYSDAVSYCPIVNDRKYGNGYINLSIPSFVCKETELRTVRLRIAIADVRTKGFLWETSLSMDKGSDYAFTALMDVVSEDKFKSSFNIFKATKGESVAVDGFKKDSAGFKQNELNVNEQLKLTIKGAMRHIDASQEVIPMFVENHVNTRETRNFLKAIHSVKKSKSTYQFPSYRGSEDFDSDKKKQVLHD